jgi:hypothetical protein
MMTNIDTENWFAGAGLTVTVVDHCPNPTCVVCAPAQMIRAA